MQGRPQMALQCYMRAVETEPYCVPALHCSIRLYSQLGNAQAEMEGLRLLNTVGDAHRRVCLCVCVCVTVPACVSMRTWTRTLCVPAVIKSILSQANSICMAPNHSYGLKGLRIIQGLRTRSSLKDKGENCPKPEGGNLEKEHGSIMMMLLWGGGGSGGRAGHQPPDPYY